MRPTRQPGETARYAHGPGNEGKPDQLYAKFQGDVPKAATQGMGYIDK